MSTDFTNTLYLIGRKEDQALIDAGVDMLIKELGPTRITDELYIAALDWSGNNRPPCALFSRSCLGNVLSVVVGYNDAEPDGMHLAAGCYGLGFQKSFDGDPPKSTDSTGSTRLRSAGIIHPPRLFSGDEFDLLE
jgi:hypothetical protein